MVFQRSGLVRANVTKSILQLRYVAIGAAILVGGALLRLRALGPVALWRDEAQAVDIARLDDGMFRFLVDHESHPPLFYFAVRLWGAAVGWSDSQLMALPFVVGIALMLVAWWTGAKLGGRSTGLLACLLTAVSATAAIHLGRLRPYGLLAILCLVMTWALWSILVKGPAWRPRMAYITASVLALYTHNWMLVVVLVQAGVVLLLVWHGDRRRIGSVLMLFLVVGLAYLPWVPFLFTQFDQAGYTTAQGFGLWDHVRLPLRILFAVPLSVVPLVLLGMFWAAFSWFRQAGEADRTSMLAAVALSVGVPLLVLVLAVASLPFTFLLTERAFSALSPLLFLGGAVLLWRPGRLLRAGAISGAAWVLVLLYWDGVLLQFPPSLGREPVQEVAARANEQDLIVLVGIHSMPTVARYWRGTQHVEAYPEVGMPRPIQFDHRTARDSARAALRRYQSLIQQAHDQGGRVWYLTHWEMPVVLWPVHDSLTALLGGLFGPPDCTSGAVDWQGLFETIDWTLYSSGHEACTDEASPR